MVMSPNWMEGGFFNVLLHALKPTSSEAIFRLFKYPTSLTIQERGRGLGPCCIAASSQVCLCLSLTPQNFSGSLPHSKEGSAKLRGSTNLWSQMNFTPL